jgi:hypothetical protein
MKSFPIQSSLSLSCAGRDALSCQFVYIAFQVLIANARSKCKKNLVQRERTCHAYQENSLDIYLSGCLGVGHPRASDGGRTAATDMRVEGLSRTVVFKVALLDTMAHPRQATLRVTFGAHLRS